MKHGFIGCVLVASLLAGSAALAEEPESPPPPAGTASTPSDDGMAGNVQFLVGQTYLSDFWKPLDEPMGFGVEVDFAPKKSPIRVALATRFSFETESVSTPYFGEIGKVGAGFLEFSGGFLWLPLRHGVVRPYLGGGAVQIFAGFGAGSGSDFWDGGDGDASFGFYADGGIFFKVGDTFNVGFDGRIVRGTNITIAGVEGNANYTQVNMLFGFSWGE
jgi:hypothetical protein